MKKNNRFLTRTSIAISLCFAGAGLAVAAPSTGFSAPRSATAQDAQSFGEIIRIAKKRANKRVAANHPRGKKGKALRRGMQQRHAARLATFDTDGDGKLSASEKLAARKAHFQAMDANKDGVVTKSELASAKKKKHEMREQKRAERRKHRAEKSAERFAKLDTDGSGGLSWEEFQKAKGAHKMKRGKHGKRGKRGNKGMRRGPRHMR